MTDKLPDNPLIIPDSDFTMKDLEQIEKFKDKGLIGLASLELTSVERCMALYVDGKTYRQIANVTKIDKSTILYLAHKYKWYEMRKTYLEELSVTLPQKILDNKLQAQEFFLHLDLAYRKKIGSDIDKYLRTGDDQWINKVDVKSLGVLMKITELIHKLGNDNIGNPNDKSLVALNGLGEGITLTKTGTNSVEITPKSPFSSKLKAFADLKREQEKSQASAKEVRDINVETQNSKKESSKNEESSS